MMIYTKFHGSQPTGSGEKEFQRVLIIYGHGGDPNHLYKFSFPCFHKLSYESWFQMTQQFLTIASFNFEF